MAIAATLRAAGVMAIAVPALVAINQLAREHLAAAILERSGGVLDLEVEEARALNRNEIPTAIAILPVGLVEGLFAETHPDVSANLARLPPDDSLRVVVIAEGGATLLHVPMKPASSGSA